MLYLLVFSKQSTYTICICGLLSILIVCQITGTPYCVPIVFCLRLNEMYHHLVRLEKTPLTNHISERNACKLCEVSRFS